MNKFVARLRLYFLNNLGAPFILGFMVLLLGCAYFLIVGNSNFANVLANVAYLLLVVGVVLQSISYFLEQRKNSHK